MATWLKNAIAKNDGYYSPRGEKLKACRLTDQQVAAFNRKQEAKAEEVKVEEPAPVVEEVVVEEAPAEEVEVAVEEEAVVEESVTVDLETVTVEADAEPTPATKPKGRRRRKK
jgi:hypothetical protein